MKRDLTPAFVWRAALAFVHDVAAAGLVWLAAYALRFNFEIREPFAQVMWLTLPWTMGVHAVLFLGFGLYRGLWRYASFTDLQRIVLAVATGALAVPAVGYFLALPVAIPRTVFLIAPPLLVVAMAGSRFAYRMWKERRFLGVVRHPQAEPVLVLGAGEAGALLVRELGDSPRWRVVGLLDDDPAKRGGEIDGVKVLGSLDEVGAVAARFMVRHVVVALPGVRHVARRRAHDLCARAGLHVMTVPAWAEIVSGRIGVARLREIELEDLLGRDPVQLDEAGLRGLLAGQSVMVTGAGGSIGAELCRQIARFAPARLVLFEQSEFALYAIAQEFADTRPAISVHAMIGDVCDERRVREVLAQHVPRIVFHAAAYKHVPLMEEENAFEAVANNAFGTLVVARAAQAAGVETFVLVSTDKAVRPANVMGASKRLAEMVCQTLQPRGATRFVAVRFGNVLGSAGSVIPRFCEQIARGGPVTVTHAEMTRYFMSIPEATQLILQAALVGRGGEVIALDMGEPVRIVDLARQLIEISGAGGSEIRIEYTGVRPGEKLNEQLLADDEESQPTPHPKLRIVRAPTSTNPRLIEELEIWIASPLLPTPLRCAHASKIWGQSNFILFKSGEYGLSYSDPKFSGVTIRILRLPPPCIAAHVIDAELRAPAEFTRGE